MNHKKKNEIYNMQGLDTLDKALGALEIEREQFLSILDCIEQPIYFSDPETYEILHQNKFSIDINGDHIGEKCHKIFQNSEEPCDFCNNELIFGENLGKTYVWEQYNKNGKNWLRHVNRAVKWHDGRMVRFNLSMDITDYGNAVEELLRFQKFESLSVLAGGLAHDFNNYLTSIIGNLSLAVLTAEPDSELYDILIEAKKSSSLAKDLIKQLLTFSMGGSLIKKPASIKELLKDSAGFALRGSRTNFKLNISDDIWNIEADTSQINQVISNLIINAEQAMPMGGTISITAENITVDNNSILPLQPGKYVKIVLEDQGVGIPEENLKKIFDPYFTTKRDSSGLGLSTSYYIITRHEGHISVDSKMGEGTVFTLYLPASKKEPEQTKAGSEQNDKTIQGRIMIMDDNAIVRKALCKMLKYLGYYVESTEEGSSAISLYKKAKEEGRPFDLIILDLTIPGGMGGKETLLHIMDYDPHVKAVASSGYSDDDDLMKNLSYYGFCAFMPKPYTIEDLGNVLYNVLMGESKS